MNDSEGLILGITVVSCLCIIALLGVLMNIPHKDKGHDYKGQINDLPK